MFRYVAFVWNETDPVQIQVIDQLTKRLSTTPTRWQCALKERGVRVYYTGEKAGSAAALTLPQGNGAVLGTLFKSKPDSIHASECDRDSFNELTSARIVVSGGRELIKNYWGSYIAVLHDTSCMKTYVLRGPASTLQCLRVKHHQVEIFFSFMEDCAQLGLRHFSIDWEYIALFTIEVVPTGQTGLKEVSEILQGECVEILNGHVSKRIYWDPLEIARTDRIEDVHEATAALHKAVKKSVHAWATCHESIILSLSGGLDSSIVLACLNDAPTHPRITCLTEYSCGSDTDEREFARLAVQGMRCIHIERRRDSSINLEGILHATRSAVPQNPIRRLEVARKDALLAHECEATAVFGGGGGDELFLQNSARLSVADFIHRHGIRPGLGRIAYDAAQLEGLSIWSILWDAFNKGLISNNFDSLAESLRYCTLVSTDLVSSLRTKNIASTAWRWSTQDLPPGTLLHASGLRGGGQYYDPMGQEGDPLRIAPLMSQPLIEVVVRIPTYLLMVGGWGRGLARRAFSDEIPMQIVRRRSKGGIEEHTQQIFSTNLRFCRELLLDGLLVKHGLLDRAKITEALAERPSSVLKGMAEISRYACIEAWLHQWTAHARCTAA
jgi:asparagine synthase (glutamine-hydrolysing)